MLRCQDTARISDDFLFYITVVHDYITIRHPKWFLFRCNLVITKQHLVNETMKKSQPVMSCERMTNLIVVTRLVMVFFVILKDARVVYVYVCMSN